MNWTAWIEDRHCSQLYFASSRQKQIYDELEWAPTKTDEAAAWKLNTELRTRITTQGLPYRVGDEAAALNSIYQMFELTRQIIKDHVGCKHFATLTIDVLNTHVRPFTAKWHQWSVEGKLSSADARFQFRAELVTLQSKLQSFSWLLAGMAHDDTVEEPLSLTLQSTEAVTKATSDDTRLEDNLWNPLKFGIADNTVGRGVSAAEINRKETEEVLARRAFYRLGKAIGSVNDNIRDAVGLSISGGGIRSATFGLGVIQQLARRGILKQVDFLSTVSGGGYLGTFLSSFLDSPDNSVTLEPGNDHHPFGALGAMESPAVRQLRNHSKYLVEGGLMTALTAVSLVAYGIVVSSLLISPLLFAAVIVALLADRCTSLFHQQSPAFSPGLVTSVVLGIVCFGVLFLPFFQKLARHAVLRRSWERGCIWMSGALIVCLAANVLPPLYYIAKPFAFRLLIVTLTFPVILGVIGLWLGPRSLAGRVVLAAFTFFGPLFSIAAFVWLLRWFDQGGLNGGHIKWAVGLCFAISLYSAFILNINMASPHSFYRDRLARTYLLRQAAPSRVFSYDAQIISRMHERANAPYHLINCAINVPASKDPNLRGRNADFFLFSKHYSGSPITGYEETSTWEAMDGHIDLGTAMAISGAAAAPNMGTLTAPRYTALLALMNIRLGYWMRKPKAGAYSCLRSLRVPIGCYYFVLEILRKMSERSAYVNLSDGGHIENLGIYELLRRRCKFVIAIDGEADPERSFGGLLTLTQMAKVDLGVTIEPDLTDLREDRDGNGRAHFEMARIDYGRQEYGLLLYIKSSLTGNESEFLRKYRTDNPDFPHQSTARQVFSEAQFEAYRELGEHVAGDLFRTDLVGNWDNTATVREWFRWLWSKLQLNGYS